MNRTNFLTQFPEFSQADTDLIDAMLAGAATQLDAEVWGGVYDQGHAYLTAHMLACSPFGQNARMSSKDGETTYGKTFKQMQLQSCSGYRVTL